MIHMLSFETHGPYVVTIGGVCNRQVSGVDAVKYCCHLLNIHE